MNREEKVRNLLTELIDMIDNGSQRDLDRIDEISESILEVIENQKTGHWISDTVDGWFKCSECEHLELGKTIYCSSCGAKMEGE